MQDVMTNIEVDGVSYPIVFNLNVMQAIQQEYETIDAWTDLTDGEEYQKRAYKKANPNSKVCWDELDDEEKEKYTGEPDARAVIFGFTEMINEGISIESDELIAKGENPRKEMTAKQVGRLLTKYGLTKATKKLNETVVESTKIEIKNE